MKSDGRVESFREAADRGPITAWHIRGLILVTLMLLADGYDTQAIGFVAPALVDAWGIKRQALGPVFSAGLFGIMIGALTMTPLADKVGVRRVLITCTGAFGVLSIASGFVNSLDALLALRFVNGLFLGAAMPTAIALVSDYAPNRMRALSITIATSGFSLGGALGGVVATVLIEDFGWRNVFFIGGAVPLLLLPLALAWLPESLARLLGERGSEEARRRTIDRLAPGWTPPPAAPQTPVVSAAARVVGLFGPGLAVATILIWIAYFMNLLNLYTLTNWLPTILHGDGAALVVANLATTFYQLGGVVGALVLAFLCDRFRPQTVMGGAFALAAAAMFTLGAVGGAPGLMVASATAAGFFVVGGQAAANAFVGSYYPAQMRATGVGWALGVGRVGSIVGPMVVSVLLAEGVDAATLLKLCAVPGVIAAVAVFFVGRVGGSAKVAPAGALPTG